MPINALTILDLPNDLRKELKQDLTKSDFEKIDRLKKRREKQKIFNRKQGALKRKIRRELKKIGATESRIKKEQNKVPTHNLKIVDNELNRISKKKGFYYIIDFGFGKPLKINIKDIATTENIDEKILKTFKKRVIDAIKKEKSKSRKKVLKKLLSALEFNLSVAKSTRDFDETEHIAKDKSQVPLLIEIAGNIIEVYIP